MDPPILGRHKEWEESETQKPRSDLELGTGGLHEKSSGVGVGIHTVLLIQEEQASERASAFWVVPWVKVRVWAHL